MTTFDHLVNWLSPRDKIGIGYFRTSKLKVPSEVCVSADLTRHFTL
jgi:hypothetical protein